MHCGWLLNDGKILSRICLVVIASVILVYVARGISCARDLIKGCLAVSTELVVEGKPLRSVLLKFKKASRIFFTNLSVAEVVKVVTELVLDVLAKLWSVALFLDIQPPSCRFQVVGDGGFTARIDNLINTAFCVGISQILFTQNERKEAHQCLFRLQNEVFIAHDVQWILLRIVTVVHDDLEEVFHLLTLAFDPPCPPLRILLRNVIVRLVSMAHCIEKSSI